MLLLVDLPITAPPLPTCQGRVSGVSGHLPLLVNARADLGLVA